MNKKPNLKSLFAALQADMISKAQFSNVLNHPVDKGDNSEENWIKWFDDYLPKRYKAAKATVVDSQGNISEQIDLALYDIQYGGQQRDSIYLFSYCGIIGGTLPKQHDREAFPE